MTEKEGSNQGVDDLLKRVLADDLPAGVEAGMRERIVRFREGTEKRGEPAGAAWTWLLGRGAAAVLSILMLVAGILLQGAKTGSPLADRISSVKSAYASLEPTRR